MAITARHAPGGLHFGPTTPIGAVACGFFVLALLLLAARLFLTPLTGLPLNFLIVFVAIAASGVLALFAVAFRRERGVAAFLALVIGLAAAAFLGAEAFGGGPPPGVTLSEQDNGRVITVDKHTQVLVQLPGNPTTGYEWTATVSDESVVRVTSEPLYKQKGDALGAGGVYNFWFEAQSSGRAEVTVVYARSWETGVEPLKTFHVTMVVR